MAQLDKETLIKHRFWIGLGAFVAIWLVGIIVVEVSGDDSKKKAWEGAKTGIEGAKSKGPKTEAFQKPWNEHGSKFKKIKDKVWKAAWDQQAAMYTWPEQMPVVPYYSDDEFGGTPDASVNNRAKYRTDLYEPQIEKLKGYVDPVEFDGKFDSVFLKQTFDPSRTPTREEIWLAQEDFWVRRDLLAVVRNTLDGIAVFREEKVDPKEKLPDGILGRRVFKNANWQLNLLLAKADRGPGWVISPQSTIKNISASRKTQPLAMPGTNEGLPFLLIQGGGSPYVMKIPGEPLPYDREMVLKKTYSTEPVDLRKDFSVEQHLFWEISPIRRIDRLTLAAHSHRTITSGLKIREDLKLLDPEPKEEAAPASASGGTGSPPGGGLGALPGAKGSSMGGPGGGSTGGGRDSTEDLTPVNKINRARYLHVTPQCRHLPFAVRIIVDQAHIHDFLAALGNSRLRIQTTQVLFADAHSVSRNIEAPPAEGSGPSSGGPSSGGPGAGGPGVSGAGSSGGMMSPGRTGSSGGSGSPPGMGSGRPKGGSPGGGSGMYGGAASGGYGRGMGYDPGRQSGRGFGDSFRPSGSGGNDSAGKAPAIQDNARLVELTVYGVATLYERFPPKDNSKTTAPTTGAPVR